MLSVCQNIKIAGTESSSDNKANFLSSMTFRHLTIIIAYSTLIVGGMQERIVEKAGSYIKSVFLLSFEISFPGKVFVFSALLTLINYPADIL